MENRIAEGMGEWSERTKRLQGIFGADLVTNKAYQLSKLDHYHGIIRSSQLPLTGDEKVSLALIKAETKRMEKDLYPSRFMRMVRSAGRLISGKAPKSKSETFTTPAFQKEQSPLQFFAPVRELKPIQKRTHPENKLLVKNRTRKSAGIKR